MSKTNKPATVYDGQQIHIINLSKTAIKCQTNHIALLRVKELIQTEKIKFTWKS